MNWLQILGPALLITLGGIVSWFVKSRIEELQAIRETLNEERRKIYKELLEPYINIFVGIKNKKGSEEQAIQQITSYDYRKTAFGLNLFGSDEVIRAYNNLMQYVYKFEAGGDQKPQPKEMMRLWGMFLLEIRKNLGNKKTKLNEIDMLRGMIKDIDKLE